MKDPKKSNDKSCYENAMIRLVPMVLAVGNLFFQEIYNEKKKKKQREDKGRER